VELSLWLVLSLLAAQAPGLDPGAVATTRPVVVIDAGHSAQDPGARSARGIGEHDLNVAVARRAQRRIAARLPVEVELVGAGERAIPPRERAALATARGAALLVSIHHDAAHAEDRISAGDGTSYSTVARGFSLHVRGDRPRSVALAARLAARLRAQGFSPTAYHASRHPPLDLALGIYRRDDLALLNAATSPTVLLECGFISDREEERTLSGAATQERIAEAIAGAVEDLLASP
jgi:N-acetylmuramoyl-L-alanine amidase